MTAPTPPPAAPLYPELPPLLDINDPDWAKFQAQDPAYLMLVAGERVRRYCGWRIYPNDTNTADKLGIGQGGRIMLPSMYVTDVSTVRIRTGQDTFIDLEPTAYEWFQNGWIKPFSMSWWGSYSGYYYGPDTPFFLPGMAYGWATVTFTHGYPVCPPDVKQVVYELVETAQEFGTANVKDIQTPGYRLALTQNLGVNLNPEQCDRLAPYRLPCVA